MAPLPTKGFVLAGLIWIAIVILSSGQFACINPGVVCTRFDLILASIAGAGYLVPAALAVSMAGLIFPSLLHKETSR